MWMTKCGAYLLEFDTIDSAQGFCEHADREWTALEDVFGYSMTVRPKLYPLIARLVPCLGCFNPSNKADLEMIEDENCLPRDSIVEASWLKCLELWSPQQSVATLRIICSDPEVANNLIRECIFVGGRQVTIQKDLKEPIRCNNCQKYGHMRNECKDESRCANCSETSHLTADCRSSHPRCVACGPNSTHSSTDCMCPTFKRLCEELDDRLPKNQMPYFPTDNPSSWTVSPPKRSQSTQLPPPPPPPLQRDPVTGPLVPPNDWAMRRWSRTANASQPQACPGAGPPVVLETWTNSASQLGPPKKLGQRLES
ncbi:Nucleic-acid-binding protein from mobile element jockey [Termitomyces sp. J132]|nr:Nucleic-acid-binding protein from mobile element jockey [Termitomyces sp. J132]